MFRRRRIALAWLALGLVAGCGPVVRTKWKVERGLAKAESAWMPNKLDYTVYQPSHRVVLATSETLKAEMAESRITRVELTRDRHFDSPDGKPPEPGSLTVPRAHPATWFACPSISGDPILVNCQSVAFEGKTKKGEEVQVQVRLEIVGSDQRTVASVQVGGRGDASGSRDLIGRISERLQNLPARPGSAEERDALQAAFDLGPKSRTDVSEATGEITISAE